MAIPARRNIVPSLGGDSQFLNSEAMKMKTIVREHPLKDIILEFDESKEQPDFEKEALSIYYEAHDELYALKKRLDVLASGLFRANDSIADLYMEGLTLEQSLDIVEDALGLSDGNDIPEITAEITIDVTALFKDIEQHNQSFQQLYELIEDLTQRYNFEMELMDPADEYQEDWPIHRRYFEMFDKVFPRYEELSVNIVSVDDDQQAFLEAYQEISETYMSNLDFAEEVFESYRMLYEFVEPMYERTSKAIEAMAQKMKGKE